MLFNDTKKKEKEKKEGPGRFQAFRVPDRASGERDPEQTNKREQVVLSQRIYN